MARGKRQPVDLKKFRHEVAALKKAGLTSKRVDARSQRPTRHMLKKVEQFRDVIEGRAKPVLIKSRELRSQYSALPQANRRVVVPVGKPTEKPRLHKSGDISISTTRNGRKMRVRVPRQQKGVDIKPPEGANIRYTVTFPRGGGSITMDDWDDFQKYMKSYEMTGFKRRQPFEWRKYLTIIDLGTNGRASIVANPNAS